MRKFTGRFDVAGNPVWTEGRILAETLYRFKGQAAAYVILCEVDFAGLDEKQRRKLFVGMTRAQLNLTLVIFPGGCSGHHGIPERWMSAFRRLAPKSRT